MFLYDTNLRCYKRLNVNDGVSGLVIQEGIVGRLIVLLNIAQKTTSSGFQTDLKQMYIPFILMQI